MTTNIQAASVNSNTPTYGCSTAPAPGLWPRCLGDPALTNTNPPPASASASASASGAGTSGTQPKGASRRWGSSPARGATEALCEAGAELGGRNHFLR